MAGFLIVFVGALEIALVFAIRPSMNKHAIEFFGIFASVLIAGGLLPQYAEIIKRKEVVGISITFLTVDILGGLFSDLSLAFRDRFDVIAALSYTAVIVSSGSQSSSAKLNACFQVMDGAIVIAAIFLNPRARNRRLQASEVTMPSVIIAHPVPIPNAPPAAASGGDYP
jgi:hypothetical protein